ncbi:hypothetical protein VTK56DRAFT_334 [Thermocarpiscus australiensis]
MRRRTACDCPIGLGLALSFQLLLLVGRGTKPAVTTISPINADHVSSARTQSRGGKSHCPPLSRTTKRLEWMEPPGLPHHHISSRGKIHHQSKCLLCVLCSCAACFSPSPPQLPTETTSCKSWGIATLLHFSACSSYSSRKCCTRGPFSVLHEAVERMWVAHVCGGKQTGQSAQCD